MAVDKQVNLVNTEASHLSNGSDSTYFAEFLGRVRRERALWSVPACNVHRAWPMVGT